ncbi:hypothetical protein NFI96_027683 [Prochilodus magdalenae]|nr:hypothetical protein NFI96_027683 [Prochilodus magdalenae]
MWNIFDLIVTSLSVLPEIVTAFSGTGTQSLKIVKLIRTFRVLRALKITAKFRELRVTVLAVTKACKELVPVCSDVQNLTYSKSFVGMSNTLSTLFILFTNNQCGSLLKEMHRVPELNYTACYIYIILWVIIAFYMRNLMAGYVVNSCRSMRNAFMEEVSQIEIQNKSGRRQSLNHEQQNKPTDRHH